jgi:S1-C subfamily serine protease
LEESVTGVYGGVGLVIRGSTLTADAEDILLEPAVTDGEKNKPPIVKNLDDEDRAALKRRKAKSMEDGIRVVSAFEGYAYDAGLRVGDKLLSVGDFEIKPTTTVEQVRNHLRGEPGTPVSITFQREGVGGVQNEPQTIEMQRSVSSPSVF